MQQGHAARTYGKDMRQGHAVRTSNKEMKNGLAGLNRNINLLDAPGIVFSFLNSLIAGTYGHVARACS
jgi:hypothetical protein